MTLYRPPGALPLFFCPWSRASFRAATLASAPLWQSKQYLARNGRSVLSKNSGASSAKASAQGNAQDSTPLGRKATPIVVQKAETVVFSDGRIVTSKIEETGPLLQSLGWTHRQIEIVGGLPAASGAWQRRRG